MVSDMESGAPSHDSDSSDPTSVVYGDFEEFCPESDITVVLKEGVGADPKFVDVISDSDLGIQISHSYFDPDALRNLRDEIDRSIDWLEDDNNGE